MSTERMEKIRDCLNKAFTPDHLEIIDDSHRHAGHAGAKESGGGHFTVTVVSYKFSDEKTIARHRMVYQSVDDLMPTEIHALSINALTPEEFNG